MEPAHFKPPRASFVLLRRRAGPELLELLEGVGAALATRGRSLTWNKCFPSQQAYWSAVSRLRKAGLVTHPTRNRRHINLQLTEAGRQMARAVADPRPHWKKKWTGLWYILMYDVPESRKVYRENLRRFLVRQRMGCLQKSVWVTPRDLRPEYDDLTRAAGLSDYAFLFASYDALGGDPRVVVRQAWPLEEIAGLQRWYCSMCENLRERMKTRGLSNDDLLRAASEENAAFHHVMDRDPLLPRALWPESYRGPEVLECHRQILASFAQCG